MSRKQITIKETDEGIKVSCSINGKYVDMTDRKSVAKVAEDLARVSAFIVTTIISEIKNKRQ